MLELDKVYFSGFKKNSFGRQQIIYNIHIFLGLLFDSIL